jgi:chromosome segregation ATPase
MADNPNMLKKIKSLFVIESEDSVTPRPATTTAKIVEKPKVVDVNPSAPSALINAEPDQNLTIKLREAIESQNLEGFDYLEFKNTLNSILHVIEDESTRYRTAYEMAKTMGASKDTLLESIQHYVDILKKEESKFKDALAHQKQKQIVSREEELSQLQETIGEKEVLIQKLTTEISDIRKKMDEKRTELKQAVDKIENANTQFSASIQAVNNQLNDDRQNLNKYI